VNGRSDHLDDDRLSDLIDGIGSDNDRVHVRHCESCRARWEAWRDVSRAISTIPPGSDERREAVIEAALAHMAIHGEAASETLVVDLAQRRKRRRLRVATQAAAAAAVVALFAGVSAALVAGGGGRASHQASTAAPTTQHAASSGAAAASPSEAAPAAPTRSSPLVALGDINTDAQLVTALRATNVSATSGSAASSGPKPSSFGQTSCAPPPNQAGSPNEEATLVWKETPAVAFVYSSPKGHTAVVESDSGCRLLTTVSY
jgi:hypothetical protein